MSESDTSGRDLILNQLFVVRSEILSSIAVLKQSVSRENSLWLQVLIGIISSLGAELATDAIDLALDHAGPPSAWVGTTDRRQSPVPDNFFDR